MNIFIPGNVPSSKNSKQWTGRFLVNSKSTQKYIRDTRHVYKKFAKEFRKEYDKISKPVTIEFKFVRGSRHKFDYINPLQTIQDMMTKFEWIEDDNADCIIPILGKYEYDKKNPGVYIKLFKNVPLT